MTTIQLMFAIIGLLVTMSWAGKVFEEYAPAVVKDAVLIGSKIIIYTVCYGIPAAIVVGALFGLK